MTVEILQRERLKSGWVRYWGAVNGVRVGVRLPASYIESVSESAAESEVKDALCSEYERQRIGTGGAYVR